MKKRLWLYPPLLTLVVGVILWLQYIHNYRRTTHSRQNAIKGNLRMISSAGQQHLIEHGGEFVRYEDLGEYWFPGSIPSVNGETYETLIVKKSGGVLRVVGDDGVWVLYTY